ncbi:MAG TPA: GNAT family N-acetyltransferase [Planctomycetota bacterium]|nr:GNAT family N-acetyltransferase [Planctomycetota bacterium]
MHLRRITAGDRDLVVGFLDRQTMALRWLVAFFRHRDLLPGEEEESWSLWRDEGPELEPISFVAAHFFHTATTYVCASEGVESSAMEVLCEEELLPERVVGDATPLQEWRDASPAFRARETGLREIEVLASGGGEEAQAGFRAAFDADIPVLEEMARLHAAESGEEFHRDFESLVEHGLVFVIEEGGRVKGYVRSNFSDGRFVHAGGLYVHPLYRRKGLGRALARGLSRHVREKDGVPVVLDVYRENGAALKTYGRAGFRKIGAGLEVRFDERAWG